MKEIRGSYDELTLKSFYDGTDYPEDYIHITLTDEEDIPDVASRLRVIYHNMMRVDYDNRRTRHSSDISGADDVETKSPLELFTEFYAKQNGTEMTVEQTEFMALIRAWPLWFFTL